MSLVVGSHPGPLPCTRYMQGAAAERELIVAWLRSLDVRDAGDFADEIEDGKHLRPVHPIPVLEGVI